MEVVGLVAGVVALGQLGQMLVDGCQKLIMLRDSLIDAPHEVDRLYQAMLRLQLITTEIRSLGPDVENLWTTSNLSLLWADQVRSMQTDISAVNCILSRLQASFNRVGHDRSRGLRARLQKVFAENKLDRYETSLLAHQKTFMFFLSVLNERRHRITTAEQRKQTKTLTTILDILRQAPHHAEATTSSTAIVISMEQNPRPYDTVAHLIHSQLTRTKAFTPKDLYAKALVQTALEQPQNISVSGAPEESSSSKDESPGAGTRPRRFSVHCRIFEFRLPIGTIYGTKVQKHRSVQDLAGENEESQWLLTLFIHPLPTVFKTVYQLLFKRSSNGSFVFRPKTHHFNADPDLRRALDQGDLDSVCRLFSAGRARVGDLVAPWGNTLLHEAITRHAVGVPNMVQLCELLTAHGADLNMPNNRKRTPLLHCCKLMLQGELISQRMFPLASLMIRHGADTSFSGGHEAQSACHLIFKAINGLDFLSDFVSICFDLDAYTSFGEEGSVDFWLISAIARGLPSFQTRLIAETRALRTPDSISSCQRPRVDNILELGGDAQVAWVSSAPATLRTLLLRTLCAHGTLAMARPFIDAGRLGLIDLNETDPEDEWSSSYARCAARTGNFEVMLALLDAGASPDQEAARWLSTNVVTSVLDEVLRRWNSIRRGLPVSGHQCAAASADSEFWVLPRLLRYVDSPRQCPNALMGAMWDMDRPPHLRLLLGLGWGRRDGQPARSSYLRRTGSEVLEAVKHNRAYLPMLLGHGLALEAEDALGCTALLWAVDAANTGAVRHLLAAGAVAARRAGYGVSPLELAASNVGADHPREQQRAWYWYAVGIGKAATVSEEQDREVYELLVQAAGNEKKLPLADCESS